MTPLVRRVATVVALTAALLGGTVTTGNAAPTGGGEPPSSASVLGGTVAHISPDSGYDASLTVRCDGGETHWVREGTNSDRVCNDEDVDAIYVRADEEWWFPTVRRGHTVWEKGFDAQGWHDWAGALNRSYVVTHD
jgi:hypothetical protein